MGLRVDADRFNYQYLGDRMTTRPSENFTHLVRDIVQRAASSIVNRGATSIAEESDVVVAYPSQHAFREELVWLMWQAEHSGE